MTAQANAFAERWIRSVKEECLSHLILFGERSLHRAVTEFVTHFHSERNHQGKGNALLFPAPATVTARRHVRCRERLVACFDITAGPLEYFYPTGFALGRLTALRACL